MSKRPRLTCLRCSQKLSYSTYCRHQNLKACPGGKSSDTSESDSDSTFYNSDNDSHSTVLSPLSVPSDDNPLYDAQDSLTYTNINEMRSGSDTECECDTSAPEVWSESDRDDVDDFATPSETEKSVSHVQNIICLYLTFLQLCYRISDRAVAFLLSLFVAVFSLPLIYIIK